MFDIYCFLENSIEKYPIKSEMNSSIEKSGCAIFPAEAATSSFLYEKFFVLFIRKFQNLKKFNSFHLFK